MATNRSYSQIFGDSIVIRRFEGRKLMKLKIATPERVILDEEVDSVSLPTVMGEITILPNHIPLVANLVAGELKYKQGGQDKFFAVSSGFIEVNPGSEVIVLSDTAEFGHEIDIDRAEKARERARQIMQESYKDEKTYADALAGLEKHLARIKVARKHRTHTQRNLQSGVLPED